MKTRRQDKDKEKESATPSGRHRIIRQSLTKSRMRPLRDTEPPSFLLEFPRAQPARVQQLISAA